MITRFLIFALIALGIAALVASAQQPTPTIAAAANAASFASGTVVPGSIATIFGSNLATQDGIVGASTLPLPLTLENVSMQMFFPPDYKAVAVPILAVADLGNDGGQINFQVPWESAAGATPQQGDLPFFEVTVNGVVSGDFAPLLASAQPGIFMCGQTLACALHADYQAVDLNHPVKPGEIILMYATGLGAVTTAQSDGQPATGTNSTLVAPTVTVAGLPAEVSYSGLAPDYVGLYQLNIQVPQGAPVGDQFVTIAMPDVVSGSNITSNAALIPVEVTTTAGTSVAISPASISLAPGATQQFAATVNGGTGKVTWSVSAGTIDSDGNFTAPAVTPNPNFFSVVATAANGASAQATITVSYTAPVITSVTPPLIYLEHGAIIGGQPGAILINGSGFAPGDVSVTCLGSLCGGITLPQGINASTLGFDAAFEGPTYDPGWIDYHVTTPDGKSSNVKSLAFLGAENLLALTATRAFVYDPSGSGYIRRFNLPDGSSDGAFTWGSAPASIAIDDLTGLVIFSADDVHLGMIMFIQDPVPVDFGEGLLIYFSSESTLDGNATTSVVAKSGIACVAEPVNGLACAQLNAKLPDGVVNPAPPMSPAMVDENNPWVGNNPWPMAMTNACATGELDVLTYSRDDQTLWKFVTGYGSTPGTVSTTVKGSLALSGFALPANLYLAGGWYLAALEPSSGGCAIALLAPKVDAQNNITFSVAFFDGVMMQQIAIADNLPQSSFRLAADNAHGTVIVAYADTDAQLTRFVKVDTTGAVTPLASTTDILTVGLQVSSDGTSIYGAMRDQFRIIPNK